MLRCAAFTHAPPDCTRLARPHAPSAQTSAAAPSAQFARVAAGAAGAEVSVDRERFEERAAEYEVADVDSFYSSALFAEHRFALDASGSRIVLAA